MKHAEDLELDLENFITPCFHGKIRDRQWDHSPSTNETKNLIALTYCLLEYSTEFNQQSLGNNDLHYHNIGKKPFTNITDGYYGHLVAFITDATTSCRYLLMMFQYTQ